MPAPRARDPELVSQRLLEWLPTRMPDAVRIEIHDIGGPSNTGFSNDTLMFDLAWEQDGAARRRGLVARFEPSGMPIFPEYDLELQYRVMHVLAETPVPVPQMLWFEPDPAVLGAPFFVMERVDGRIPTDNPPYHSGGWVSEIEPAERESLWWSGLDAMVQLHRLDWQRLDLGFLRPVDAGADPLDQHLAYYERFLEWMKLRGRHPLCDRALDWLRSQRPAGPAPLRACWGDSRIGNMIFRDGLCAAVLDWEMARLGNPVEDLAWWLFIDRHHHEAVGVPRLPGFPSREDTVARWEAGTELSAADLDYYELFAAFRFAVIMGRVGQQMKAYELIPEDSSFDVDNTVTRMLERLLSDVGAGVA